jgi:hypothetical protein
MERARWKELNMDTAEDGEVLGRFWAAATGLELGPAGGPDHEVYVVGPTEGHGIAIGPVPEAKSVKHRVHLDVYCATVEELVGLGATVVLPAEESGHPFTVMTDPEGGEFCAFVHEDPPDYRLFQLVVDAVDAEAAAYWWAEVLHGTAHAGDDAGWWRLVDVPGLPFERLTFQQVPEPKTVKNRIHWDVYSTVEEMLAAGATLLRERDDEIGWSVMADPEGNEFCVFDR